MKSFLELLRLAAGWPAYFSEQTDRDMAPSNISPGSAATVLSFLALAGLQLETRFRVGEVLARQ